MKKKLNPPMTKATQTTLADWSSCKQKLEKQGDNPTENQRDRQIWFEIKVENSFTPALASLRSNRYLCLVCCTPFFLYKHFVHKHDKPQILEKSKHVLKHAPGWDFQFGKKNLEFKKRTKQYLDFCFLVADTRLYTLPCWSACRSVRPSRNIFELRAVFA